jgi:hypothetical protein
MLVRMYGKTEAVAKKWKAASICVEVGLERHPTGEMRMI